MSKAIAMIWGAWIMYCTMIGSYDGAIVLLIIYIFNPIKIDWHDLFKIELENKKDTTAGDSRVQNK